MNRAPRVARAHRRRAAWPRPRWRRLPVSCSSLERLQQWAMQTRPLASDSSATLTSPECLPRWTWPAVSACALAIPSPANNALACNRVHRCRSISLIFFSFYTGCEVGWHGREKLVTRSNTVLQIFLCCSSCLGLLAITSATAFSIALLPVIWFKYFSIFSAHATGHHSHTVACNPL